MSKEIRVYYTTLVDHTYVVEELPESWDSIAMEDKALWLVAEGQLSKKTTRTFSAVQEYGFPEMQEAYVLN